MKTVFLNLLVFVLLTISAVYAFQVIQTKSVVTDDPHAGHDHSSNTTESSETDVHTNHSEAQPKEIISPSERDPNRLWCREHGLYEDECLICHPEIATKQDSHEGHDHAEEVESHEGHDHAEEVESHEGHDHAEEVESHEGHDHAAEPLVEPTTEQDAHAGHNHEAEALDAPATEQDPHAGHNHSSQAGGHIETSEGLFCAEHRVLETQCGICQPQLADQLLPGESMKVRLPSITSIQMAKIQTGKPLSGSLPNQSTFLCEIKFNQSQMAHVSPLSNGIIQKVYVDYGDVVEQGDILFDIVSTDIAKAKSDYLKALDQENLKQIIYEREKTLKEKNITSKQAFQQAEVEFQIAQTETMTSRQQLLNYGLSSKDVGSVRTKRSTTSLLKVRAPFSGTLIEKHAVLGESVTAGEPLIELIDLSTLWLTLSIPESKIASVQRGDFVQAEFPNLPGVLVQGEITWIASRVDENSRMIQARVLVQNSDGKLKQGFYGKVRVIKHVEKDQLLVPDDSVQYVDGTPFIFVKREDDLFELRRIIPGNKANQQIEILDGLNPEDEIVIARSFALKSEFLKSRFGAGCADH